MDDPTLAYYDADPRGYADSTFSIDMSAQLERFASGLPPGGRVLDLGCGSGRDALALTSMGFEVVPTDGSEGMCAEAGRRTGLEVRLLRFDDLDYDSEFDGVWACASLLHVPSTRLPTVLSSARRALVPGGRMFACFKHGTFEGMRGGRWYTDMDGERLAGVLEGTGLSAEDVRTVTSDRGEVWLEAILVRGRRRTRRSDAGILNVHALCPAMAFDGRAGIVDIDEDERTVIFDTYRLKKITGTRVAPILGMSDYSSPFKVACEIAGLYPGDKPNKYIEAGNVLEPVIRAYVARNADGMLRGPLHMADGSRVGIEEPVEKELCGYDHFHNDPVFGGMVDGYVVIDGRRSAILEIKTSNDRSRWEDGEGGVSNIPTSYMLQASLYARLSNLDTIVFAVGFLEEPDYDRPKQWVPGEGNTGIVVVPALEMDGYMEQCRSWYDEYIKGGYTPEWSDSESDQEVLRYLRAYKPGGKGRGRRRWTRYTGGSASGTSSPTPCPRTT